MSTTGHPHRPVVNKFVGDLLLVPSITKGECWGCKLEKLNQGVCPHDENNHTVCTRNPDGSILPQDYIWIENTEAAIAAYVARRLGG